MNYKTVMVSQALDRPNDACLAVASDLAELFEPWQCSHGILANIVGPEADGVTATVAAQPDGRFRE
ncbi:hypothetical protein ASC80_10345 [Afipia sp. Root123D2]|uniref:hypothetical protein n=1 Tax=Afipia sp. Root123D2 TaxID=1736436 RepID=UPI0006FD84B8|nr:hypothetical protein [Afipia sp. Root123D2]KQW20628.1 hypothetical protein ASC80_10345 [Afipia sp. Root123D2]